MVARVRNWYALFRIPKHNIFFFHRLVPPCLCWLGQDTGQRDRGLLCCVDVSNPPQAERAQQWNTRAPRKLSSKEACGGKACFRSLWIF